MKTEETKNKFIELRAKGFSYDKIAKQLKVSKQTLINWGKEFEKEIGELKAFELETLREKYYLQKQKRIELFGEGILRIKDELSQRDLKKLHTHRLFDILIKIFSLFDREERQAVEVDKMQAYIKKLEMLCGIDKKDQVTYIISDEFLPKVDQK